MPTKSCDKFQNQTFKDRCSTALRGDKKLNLGADFKARVSRRSFHCRDKIEFNLKSQKLEEPFAFVSESALLRGVQTRDFRSPVNEFFELSSNFIRRPHFRAPAFAAPFGCGTRKLANSILPTSGFLKKFSERILRSYFQTA